MKTYFLIIFNLKGKILKMYIKLQDHFFLNLDKFLHICFKHNFFFYKSLVGYKTKNI